MTNLRIHALSLPSLNSPSTSRPSLSGSAVSTSTMSRPSRTPSRPPMGIPALSLALAAVFATSACGSDEPQAQAADGSSSVAAPAADDAEEAPEGEAPDACSLLTVEDLKTATGYTFDAGEGTDYDNTCRFNTDSDTVVVNISDESGLEFAEPIGIDVVPVEGLPDATRVDGVVYVEVNGYFLSVGTALPGFNVSEREAVAAEELAKVAAGRM